MPLDHAAGSGGRWRQEQMYCGKKKPGVPLELSTDSLKSDFCLHQNASVESRIRGHSGHTHPKIVAVSHAYLVPTAGA